MLGKSLLAAALLASAEGLKIPAPVTRRDAIGNAGVGLAAAFSLAPMAAHAKDVPNIFTVIPNNVRAGASNPNGQA